LKAGDSQATAAFNRDAAAYTARKVQLDTLRAQSQANDNQLTDLLQKQADFQAQAYAAAHAVIVYGTLTCPACRMAREYLSSKGVAFRDVDIEHDPQGAAEFQQRGGGGVPMIVINGAQFTGFSSAWVDDHL
jgi:glutaredoxin